MIWHEAISVNFAKRSDEFLELIEEVAIILIFEKNEVFVVATVINVIMGVGIDFHVLNIQQKLQGLLGCVQKLTKFLEIL